MNSINNDINRFDGKYLKCIVSKYPSVLKFLANSGSMIVLQPQSEFIKQDISESINNGEYYITDKSNDGQQRNYVYLGDEFLASGYGFTTIQYRNSGERIIKSYDNTIRKLKKADSDEADTRFKEDEKIWGNFEKYVEINGGPIENTIINFDGDSTKKIKTRDIILYGEEAQYDDLSIEEVIVTIYDNNMYPYKSLNNTCIFPFGGNVSNIIIEIVGKDNDSGGLSYLEVLHDFHRKDSNYDENEGIIIKYDTDVDNKIIIPDNIDSQYNLHKWVYYKQLNDSLNELIIDEEKNNVIKDVYLYVKETPTANYKYYPGLLNRTYVGTDEKIHLVSSGNAIKNHKLSLGIKLNIKPQYYIFYNFKKDISLNNFNDDKILPLNMINEDYTTSIDIYIDNSNTTDVQIAVPINFALRKFNLVKNNINKFNLTGLVKKIKSNVLMRCPKSKINNDIYFCTNYDIYKFESDQPIESDVKINLEIVYDGKNQLNIIQKSFNELNNNFIENNTNELLNDEEFNNIYWMNNNKGDLIDRLNKSQENGIVKE